VSQRRVAITGLGLVSPYGGDLADFFARLSAGESAIRYLLTDDLPRPLSIPFVSCPAFDPDAALGKPLASMMDRFAQLGMAAAFGAWDDAGLSRKTEAESRDSWGVSWGTALGGTLAYEKGYRELWQKGRERLSPLAVVLGMNNAANAHISIQLGLGGISMSHTACRPFGADRRGLVLGEGGAALVLEDWDHAVARGARIHGEMVGYGTSCDHSHLVRPEVEGQVRALNLTLADAGLVPDDIDYINAHGTATAEGDPVEVGALKAVFGERAGQLPVSATKSMHGHLLGAAGAIEAIATVLALREQVVPPTANLQDNLDPACAGVDHVTTGRRQTLRTALSNSFAFGGSNAVLAFRAVAP